MAMDNEQACIACRFLGRACMERCHFIPLLDSYYHQPRFQLGYAVSPADRQQIEARITENTKRFEEKARTHEQVFGVMGLLIALDLRVRDEVQRLYNMVGGIDAFCSNNNGIRRFVHPEMVDHFVLNDIEKIEQQHRACPMCTYLPRKCEVNCPYVRFFEAEDSGDFEDVYALLWSTTTNLPHRPNFVSADECDKWETVGKTLEYEAKARVYDPVYGTIGLILYLYKYWWNVNQYVNMVEESGLLHQNVHNLPTAQVEPVPDAQPLLAPDNQHAASSSLEAATPSQQGISSSTGTPPTSTTTGTI